MKKSILIHCLIWTLSMSAQVVSLGNLNPDGSSNPTELFAFGNILLFAANDGTHGNELWKSNGSEQGTVMIGDLIPSEASSNPSDFVIYKDTAYFSAYISTDEAALWKTDGSAEGTLMVKSFPNSRKGIYNLAVLNGDLLFFVDNSTDSTHSVALWKTRGNADETVLVRDSFYAVSKASNDLDPSQKMAYLNNELYFVASNDTLGLELWKTNGTDSGTVMVKDIALMGGSDPLWLTTFKDHIYFTAYDNDTLGRELWKTDGSTEGTVLVRDIYKGSAGSNIQWLSAGDNLLLFSASNESNGNEPWSTDGTEEGTQMILNLDTTVGEGENGSNPRELIYTGSFWFFAASGTETNGVVLYKTDGTSTGTVPVKDIPQNGGNNPESLILNNEVLYYTADTAWTDKELWQSDGTDAGTYRVADIALGATSSSPQFLTLVNDYVFLSAETETEGRELFRTGLVTTVADQSSDAQVSEIWPNPTSGISYVSGLNIGDRIEVRDVLGQLVLNRIATDPGEAIHLEQQPQGVYLVQIKYAKGGSAIHKIIKQ